VEIGRYIHAVRAHRLIVALSVLVCTGGAAILAWTTPPTYVATTQFFVAAEGRPGEVGQAFEGGRYGEQRARTYADILDGPGGAQLVIDQVGLEQSVQSLEGKIDAKVPANSPFINVTVRDPSGRVARSIADSLGHELPTLAEDLERPEGRERSPVKVTVTEPTQLSDGPDSPRKPIYLAFGILFGLVIGIAGAVLRDVFDRRVRSDADAGVTASAPVLGTIAEYRGTQPPVTVVEPLSAAAEGYRALRSSLRALSAEHDIRSFVVSSAVPSEGKTDVVANLGVALAEADERVVVVDANLRSPGLGERLGVKSSIGLSDLLVARRPVELALRRHSETPLEVLTSGSRHPSLAELLDSDELDRVLRALTSWFEFVIVDTPALLAVADAAAVARRVSAAILVARAGSTSSDDLNAARKSLRAVDARVLGVVVNRVRERDRRLHREEPAPPSRSGARTVAPARSDGQGGPQWLS
jgi:capsular exopolysaccharide synthesis family protein